MTTLTITASHDYRNDTLSNITDIVFSGSAGVALSVNFLPIQFDDVQISSSVHITGTSATDTMTVNAPSATGFSAANWTFSSWNNTSDSILIEGSSGADFFIGSS